MSSVRSFSCCLLTLVRYPLETEIIHQLIVKVRTGSLPFPLAGRKFNNVIYAGHSFGSIIGNALVTQYPADVDTVILTGWSSSFITVVPTAFGEAMFLPACLAEPARFGNLPLGYLEGGSKLGLKTLFWAGAFDNAFFEYDFANRRYPSFPLSTNTEQLTPNRRYVYSWRSCHTRFRRNYRICLHGQSIHCDWSARSYLLQSPRTELPLGRTGRVRRCSFGLPWPEQSTVPKSECVRCIRSPKCWSLLAVSHYRFGGVWSCACVAC